MVRQTIVVQPVSRAAARTRAQPIEAPSTETGTKTRQRRPAPEIAPVVRAKIQPPALRPTTLTRERLLERLTEAVGSRVTLVTADAGYGKTTLLADFSMQSGLRTLWYRLDPTDADTITWTNYLVAACREVDPDFGQATRNLLRHIPAGEPPKTAFVASFLGELARMAEAPTLLILDDFHEVDHSAEVREFVGRLIELAPPWLRLVIAGRRRPAVEFARLAGMGELNEIGLDELRFSTAETERLFTESYGMPLDADVLREVDRRTRGWVASLQLFHGSVRGRPASAVRALARSLSGADSPIFDFLAQEVLANVSDELNEFLVRVALLERVVAGHVVALFADGSGTPSHDEARLWIEEADRLGLITRSSQTSEARQMHPLLRDFLLVQLMQRFDRGQIREMHLRVAEALVDSDPLTACRHYIEGGAEQEAMACLGRSVMLTMGSGQWGVASDLIDRLEKVPAGPAVAAIRARRLIEDGDLVGAERLLVGTDISAAPPDERAVVRHARLSLGWRTGDSELLSRTLAEMQEDPETPPIMRDIAQVFIDASPMSPRRTSLTSLGRRLVRMSSAQKLAGYDFYCAISLHNASVAFLQAGDYSAARVAAQDALATFDGLSFQAPERHSTLSMLALSQYELGDSESAEVSLRDALASGEEFADVPAEMALVSSAIGRSERAVTLTNRAEALCREGRSDLVGTALTSAARAFVLLRTDPREASAMLAKAAYEAPLDLGHSLVLRYLRALALFLSGDTDACLSIANDALGDARQRGAHRVEVRLSVLAALASANSGALQQAIGEASSSGALALDELADVISASLDVISQSGSHVDQAVARRPDRWLPSLRRQLQSGSSPAGRQAAVLVDAHGEAADIGLLRAFAKTYRRKGVGSHLGLQLARRRSPGLVIRDLGPVAIEIGDRRFLLAEMRRKPAALLMYLVTRPAFTANREQVLDELWPDADLASSANSLNQSLYFLRRDIDPWYEDDLTAEYVRFEGDLVALDQLMVTADSTLFMADAMSAPKRSDGAQVLELLRRYGGHFAPDFEYEEWAIAWRARLRSTMLKFAHGAITGLEATGNLEDARDAAIAALAADQSASEIERQLVWLHWHLGATSAARAQYDHLLRQEQSDGLKPLTLAELVNAGLPR